MTYEVSKECREAVVADVRAVLQEGKVEAAQVEATIKQVEEQLAGVGTGIKKVSGSIDCSATECHVNLEVFEGTANGRFKSGQADVVDGLLLNLIPCFVKGTSTRFRIRLAGNQVTIVFYNNKEVSPFRLHALFCGRLSCPLEGEGIGTGHWSSDFGPFKINSSG
ncbi:hypothetical protein L7F22_032163 [Adiantum nelumboides]|nr:hypothetical protein [Adiantum nelumboides]